MHTALVRDAIALAFRGVLAVVFGLTAFAWPHLSTAGLVLLFGAYAVADGLFALAAAAWAGTWHLRRWPFLGEAGASVLWGAFAFLRAGMPEFELLTLIATWAIVTGIFECAAAAAVELESHCKRLLALNSLASVLLGVLLLTFPGGDVLTVVWLVGVYACLFGILLLMLAFRLRALRHHLAHHPA